jgi:hypothetical protein
MATPIVGSITYQTQLDPIRPTRSPCVALRPAAGVDGLAVAQGAAVPEPQRIRFRAQWTGGAYQAQAARDAILQQIGTTVAVYDCHGETWSCIIMDAEADYSETVFTGQFAMETTYILLVLDA